MQPFRRYRLRCTTDDCDLALEVAGPDTNAHSPRIWVLFRAHCDMKHHAVKHPTAWVTSLDPEYPDDAELIL